MTRRHVPTSRRVEQLVRRSGGSLPERLVAARLTLTHGRAEAKDGIRRALERELVWRRHVDGEDCLATPDGDGPPDDRFDAEGREWPL